jgi:UMF1 family MFS transporter
MAKMLKGYRRILQTIKFLIAWAFLSNSQFLFSRAKFQRKICKLMGIFHLGLVGYSTMTSTAVLYAKAYLKMESSKLIVIGILTPSMGIMGALIFSAVQKHIQYFSGVGSSLKVLKLVVIPTCAIPLYMSTSVLFKSKALSSERDMYLVAAFFGK